jgi:hypothetical protein
MTSASDARPGGESILPAQIFQNRLFSLMLLRWQAEGAARSIEIDCALAHEFFNHMGAQAIFALTLFVRSSEKSPVGRHKILINSAADVVIP